MERIPPGELSLEQLDALAAEGRIGLERYWQLRTYLEQRDTGDERSFDLPLPPEPGTGGGGFVPPPPRRPVAAPPVPPPPPFVPPPPPATGRTDWVRLDVDGWHGPSAEAAPTRADERAGRKRRRRRDGRDRRD